ncbi:NAD(P)/FAD-dependent oxidoreductase [Thiothrix nivea]|uniref:FAD-dependent pyridine nucleotide-disulfide oxidoreductase n=1 Tax=Thiothrix nivea (strain ATCC 35100 / DSM 5205 / JP2) TaxID=870187 RepID=A0A656HHI9_THINJ|nr:FAD-dependent oxidoreductase [Thiothrix nivea]EIJ34840.1 FAD-dependent pyridine nucleotide-disulfide oxidoreductase [Thiothrix nivea DSM 5205]
MKHVIIGTGPAGVIAAETLRKRQPDACITLVGGEPEPPYSRMAIPYHLIGKVGESGTYLRSGSSHFIERDIALVGLRATAIDANAKAVMLEDGDSLPFDKLLLATGSHPTRPPIPGMDLPGVVNCWTLADARRIITGANAGDDVVLMGAGFIGCIILEALALRGVNLTVVEMENRMVPRMMDDQSGGLLKQWCESKGVTVLTSTRVLSVSEDGDKLAVELDGRDPLTVNLVICATGVRPNTELASGLLDVNHGILVNERLQTSHPDIYAAGDVAEGKDFSTGGYSVQAIQPTAVEHGALAAINMSGGTNALHRGSINMNVLDTMGLISASFGLWQGAEGGDSATLDNPQRYRYINLRFADDVLVGANTLGMTQHIGVLRGLIQNRTRLGKWKQHLMADPTRVMEAYLAHHVPRQGP